MTLTTRPPTGKAPWPLIAVAGIQKSGKTYTAVEFSASNMVNRTFAFEFGESSMDQYGAIPGARFEIVTTDGTFRDLLAKLKEAAAIPFEGGKPNCIVVDSGSRLWEVLSDEAQLAANNRQAVKDRKYNKPNNPDQDYTIGSDLWNRAKGRWYDVLNVLLEFPGPAIMTARMDEVAVMDAAGAPTKEKTWKISAHKRFPFEVDAIIEMRTKRNYLVTGLRSMVLDVPAEGLAIPNLTIEKLIHQMGVNSETAGTRSHVPLDAGAHKPRTDLINAARDCPTQEDCRKLWGDVAGHPDVEEIRAHITARVSALKAPTVEPSTDGQPEPEALTDPQLRKLHVLFKEKQFTGRDDNLAFLESIGITVTSTKELTKAQARTAIDALEKVTV